MLLFRKLKIREVNTSCKLIGPNIDQAKSYIFRIDGSELKINLPKHHSSLKYPTPRTPKREYSLDNYYLENSIPSKNGWGSLVCAARSWDFYGPVFAGELGTLSMVATVDTSRNNKPATSYFHPRYFEQLVAEYVTYHHGEAIYQESQDWLAPSYWKPISRFDCVCASFQVRPAYGIQQYEIVLMLPISDTKLFTLHFTLDWQFVSSSSTPYSNTTEQHDISNMEQLCKDIIDSLEIKLSDKALAQQNAALNGLEDTSLVSEYPPLKWESNKVVSL